MKKLFILFAFLTIVSAKANHCSDPYHEEDPDCMRECAQEFNECTQWCESDHTCVKGCIKLRAECEVEECDHCP